MVKMLWTTIRFSGKICEKDVFWGDSNYNFTQENSGAKKHEETSCYLQNQY